MKHMHESQKFHLMVANVHARAGAAGKHSPGVGVVLSCCPLGGYGDHWVGLFEKFWGRCVLAQDTEGMVPSRLHPCVNVGKLRRRPRGQGRDALSGLTRRTRQILSSGNRAGERAHGGAR